jgi:hypothetical protein
MREFRFGKLAKRDTAIIAGYSLRQVRVESGCGKLRHCQLGKQFVLKHSAREAYPIERG